MKLILEVSLNYKKSISIAKASGAKIIVVKARDFLSKSSGKLNLKFARAKNAGSIHNFLDFDGIVILSFVMEDTLIRKLNKEIYSELIKILKPQAYTSPDAETYNLDREFSWSEIKRIMPLTKYLLSACPDSIPIGHVKGCDEQQILFHYNFLKNLGFKIFLFHTGDFFRGGDEDQINLAKYFCSLIKSETNLLFLHGFNSQKRLVEFSFCDACISYGHIIAARQGATLKGTNKSKYSLCSFFDRSLFILKDMESNLLKLNEQTKLFVGGKCQWEEELEPRQELVIKR